MQGNNILSGLKLTTRPYIWIFELFIICHADSTKSVCGGIRLLYGEWMNFDADWELKNIVLTPSPSYDYNVNRNEHLHKYACWWNMSCKLKLLKFDCTVITSFGRESKHRQFVSSSQFSKFSIEVPVSLSRRLAIMSIQSVKSTGRCIHQRQRR